VGVRADKVDEIADAIRHNRKQPLLIEVLLIAVLKKVRYALCPMPYALCPMPYALCPMPYAQSFFLRKAITTAQMLN